MSLSEGLSVALVTSQGNSRSLSEAHKDKEGRKWAGLVTPGSAQKRRPRVRVSIAVVTAFKEPGLGIHPLPLSTGSLVSSTWLQ